MNEVFGMTDELKQLLEAYRQAQQNQQQQEPLTGQQYTDNNVRAGLEAAKGATYQQQAATAMSAPPTPETQQAVQAIQQQQLMTPERWRLWPKTLMPARPLSETIEALSIVLLS